MSHRYTRKQLEESIDLVNGTMERVGIDHRYMAGYRHGYTALDVAIGAKDVKDKTPSATLKTGTPADCRDAMYLDAFWVLAGIVPSKRGT